jgi:hypothetical protein
MKQCYKMFWNLKWTGHIHLFPLHQCIVLKSTGHCFCFHSISTCTFVWNAFKRAKEEFILEISCCSQNKSYDKGSKLSLRIMSLSCTLPLCCSLPWCCTLPWSCTLAITSFAFSGQCSSRLCCCCRWNWPHCWKVGEDETWFWQRLLFNCPSLWWLPTGD